MKKGDVGMVKRFSKIYRNNGRAFKYLQSESYVKMPCQRLMLHPHCLKNKELKLIWLQWSGSKYLVLCTVEDGVANTSI